MLELFSLECMVSLISEKKPGGTFNSFIKVEIFVSAF